MTGFLIVFGVTLAGYAGVGLWAIVAGAIGLASLSHANRQRLHQRASELGLATLGDQTFLTSLANALAAASLGYFGGMGFAAITQIT